ncbi:hypothetical protein [Halorubrum sp. CSM-61]|uniref:DUF7573 domain-containing protein n=1 Tax=Halorubrum sp. CSM-61 TaxID=2485838 RepID=UPI000F4C36C9|nr:hypothetical protein [Halorubrum sp. CSM-61]
MPEDRSLDEFEGSDAETETVGDGSPSADSTDGAVADDPAPATATWTAGGADCERCGDSVERRWLDDGERVCPDCKSW